MRYDIKQQLEYLQQQVGDSGRERTKKLGVPDFADCYGYMESHES